MNVLKYFALMVGREHGEPGGRPVDHSAAWEAESERERTNHSVEPSNRLARRSLALPFIFLSVSVLSTNAQTVTIGSKKFTESYVLSEIAKRALRDAGIPVEHKQGMGGTIILWEALRASQIDAYPEYSGTIAEEILKDRRVDSAEKM